MSLMVRDRRPMVASKWAAEARRASTCRSMKRASVRGDSGMRSNTDSVTTTASHSPTAARATNRLRPVGPCSASVGNSTLAAGYRPRHSVQNCSSMWFGTTTIGLLAIPRRRSSIAAMTIVAVLPAPTSWASSAEGSARMRATASRWWARGVKVSARPGRVRWEPS